MRVVLLLGAAAVLSACRIDASVEVVVGDDGAGQVRVNAAFDDEALTRAGDLRLDDVRAAGWTVTGPQKEPDRDTAGLWWIRATKDFTGGEQFTAIMTEINGPNGIFRDFRLARSKSFAKVTYTVTGTIDAARGIESFSDPEVTQLLGGDPLGRPNADVVRDSADASLVFAVVLPDNAKGAADRIDGRRAEWDVALGRASTPVAVHSDDVQGAARRWVAVAVVLAVAAIAVAALGFVRRGAGGDSRGTRSVNAPVPRTRTAPPATVRAVTPATPPPAVAPASGATTRPSTAAGRKRIQMVVLDAMGVLYRDADDVEALLIPFVSEHGGLDDPLVIRARYVDATLGRHTTSELWSLLGVPGDAAALDRAYIERFELSDGVHEFLDAMDQRRVGVACLTNDVVEWSLLLRRRFELDTRVRPWIVSGDVGVRKPSEAIFAELERALDVPLRACLLVDDRIDNLATGRKLGMAAVHLAPQPVDESPYRRVSSLFELFNRGRVTT